MKSVVRSISAFIGFSALALQFWLEVGLPHGPSVIGSTFNFVSYLTILANTFAVLAMLLPLVAPGAALGRFLSRPSVRTAIAGYMVIGDLLPFGDKRVKPWSEAQRSPDILLVVLF